MKGVRFGFFNDGLLNDQGRVNSCSNHVEKVVEDA